MGIRSFFKRAGNWVKDKFHAVKNGVTKFAKAAAPIIKKGVNFIDKTPISGVINTFTGGAFDKAKKLIDLLPDGSVKDKINEYKNKAEDMRNRVVDEVDKRQNQARGLIDKGREIIDKGQKAWDIVGGSKGLAPPM